MFIKDDNLTALHAQICVLWRRSNRSTRAQALQAPSIETIGGTRSDKGKRFVERITTVAQILRMQDQNVLHFIQKSVDNFYARSPPPFIFEAMGF